MTITAGTTLASAASSQVSNGGTALLALVISYYQSRHGWMSNIEQFSTGLEFKTLQSVTENRQVKIF